MRRAAALLVAFAALGLPAAPAVAPGRAAAVADDPPNILVILTDDQRASGTLGVMPQMRRWFRKGGTRYPNAYATTPVCCPSRASIFTGQYAHNHDVHTNKEGGHIDEDATVQRALRDAGYRTALLGKYLNGWPAERVPRHWDRWAMMAPPGYRNARFNINGSIRRVRGYTTDFLARRASSFIRQFEQEGAPWFVTISVYAPHEPFTPAKKYRKTKVPKWKGNPATAERDRSDKPPYVRGKSKKLKDLRTIRQAQLRTLRSVDDLVARVFKTLGKVGAVQDTLAIFLSDHGFLWGEHGLKAKNYPYLPSIRLPLLMRWPGRVAAGAADRRLVANVDVAPTILHAAGAAPAEPMDGRSLLDPFARDRMFTEAWPENFVPTWASILTGNVHYIEYHDNLTGEVTYREYYDLAQDPWELENLLGDADPSNDPPAGEVTALSLQVKRDRGCVGTSGPDACP